MPTVSINSKDLSIRRIFHFWKPLAATWLMMSVEGPTLTAMIARLPEAKLNLAAFGVAFAFALLVEAPVIMMMSASTALVQNRPTYLKLRNFTHFLNAGITGVMLIGLLPGVHSYMTLRVLGLSPNLAHRTWLPLLLLLPWPGMIGLRRFNHGILIRHGLTNRVAWGTMVRLLTMLGSATLLLLYSPLPGAALGAAALSSGVTAEAAMSHILARRTIQDLLNGKIGTEPRDRVGLRYLSITSFYTPLALTAFLGLGIQPIVTFFMAYAKAPIESLAVLPVINSLVFIFRAPGLAFQEVAIALLGEKNEGYRSLSKFALILGFGVILLLGLIAWTPLSFLWYRYVSGLSIELARFSVLPTQILAIMPGLTLLIAFQRALLVHAKTTRPVTWASLIEVGGVVLVLGVCIVFLDLPGVAAAATALLLGRLSANLSLATKLHRAKKEGGSEFSL